MALAATHADGVLRIVDEALANVWRHANATRVEVSLARRGVQVSLSIRDNGGGLAADRRDGMGLSNMHARASELPDGALHVESRETGGTQVDLHFNCAPGVRP